MHIIKFIEAKTISFTWPHETGLAHSHAHLNRFQNILKRFETGLTKPALHQVFSKRFRSAKNGREGVYRVKVRQEHF